MSGNNINIGASKVFGNQQESINGIKLTKKSEDGLYHLDKHDQEREKFKDRIKIMNQQVDNIKKTISNLINDKSLKLDKDNPIIQAINELPTINDSSYNVDNTDFQFLNLFKELTSIIKDVPKELSDFDIDLFEQKIEANAIYKKQRINAKKILIEKNLQSLSDEEYIKLKYDEKSKDEDSYYIDQKEKFYLKKSDNEKLSNKRLLRRKYRSAEDHKNQLNMQLERQEYNQSVKDKLKTLDQEILEASNSKEESKSKRLKLSRENLINPMHKPKELSRRERLTGRPNKNLLLDKIETREVLSEKQVCVMNKETGKKQEINLPINLFNQLFPNDQESTLSPIQTTGDCYLVNAFNVFMKNFDMRMDIYKCFKLVEEKGEIFLNVKYPGNEITLKVPLDNQGLINFSPNDKALDGPVGLQMLEELQLVTRLINGFVDDKDKIIIVGLNELEIDQADKESLKNLLLDCSLGSIEDRFEKLKEQFKKYDSSISQEFLKKIDERQEFLKKSAERQNLGAPQDMDIFNIIDSGTSDHIKQLMNYNTYIEEDIIGDDVWFVSPHVKNSQGIFLNQHAQQIISANKYGFQVVEPNTSNRIGDISYDQSFNIFLPVFSLRYRQYFTNQSAEEYFNQDKMTNREIESSVLNFFKNKLTVKSYKRD